MQSNEDLEIMVNTVKGKRETLDLIEFISNVRETESALAKNNKVFCCFKTLCSNFLVTVLAQINWSAQPFKVTDKKFNQKNSELEDYNEPDKDKQIKINEVDTVLNLRGFDISDLSIVDKMKLFNSKYRDDLNDLSAYGDLKELYPCLQRRLSFSMARKRAVAALKSQGNLPSLPCEYEKWHYNI